MVEALFRLGQRMLLAGLERDVPEQACLADQTLELFVHVALVTEHRPVIFTHPVRQLVDVRAVGWRHGYGMHEPGIDVGTHVNLHAKLQLVALLVSRSRCLSQFFVEGGAWMIVASTIVPPLEP